QGGDGHEGDQHRAHVDGEIRAHRGAVRYRVENVRVLDLQVHLHLAAGERLLLLRHHHLRDDEGGGSGEEGGGDEVARDLREVALQHEHVGAEYAARGVRETADHDGHELRPRHLLYVG